MGKTIYLSIALFYPNLNQLTGRICTETLSQIQPRSWILTGPYLNQHFALRHSILRAVPSLPGHPPALLASDTGVAFGVFDQELHRKRFLQPTDSKISEYFVDPAQDEKAKNSDFSLKKTQNTFWEREELFLTRPDCVISLELFYVYFIPQLSKNESRAK